KLAQGRADVIICSIFVNPTQFTDPKDLEKYPRPIEHDLAMLSDAGCNGVFMPDVNEMYPSGADEDWHIDLGKAEFLLEGQFRKGHYQGVTQIVKKLFDAVEPDVAMFGQKDFQQVLMIKNMLAHFNLPITIVTCPIIREDDGLAMSSRNIHLSKTDRKNALVLSKSLQFVLDNFDNYTVEELETKAKSFYKNLDGVELDYFTIANGNTLENAKHKEAPNLVALVAAKVGSTRLIDNMIIK
ncbi:MAG: pantoate--beta-alanine ligase, partial [Pedobacter sp.]